MNTYGTLPTEDFLKTVRKAAENHFTVVGYGLQGFIKPFYEDKWNVTRARCACSS